MLLSTVDPSRRERGSKPTSSIVKLQRESTRQSSVHGNEFGSHAGQHGDAEQQGRGLLDHLDGFFLNGPRGGVVRSDVKKEEEERDHQAQKATHRESGSRTGST